MRAQVKDYIPNAFKGYEIKRVILRDFHSQYINSFSEADTGYEKYLEYYIYHITRTENDKFIIVCDKEKDREGF